MSAATRPSGVEIEAATRAAPGPVHARCGLC